MAAVILNATVFTVNRFIDKTFFPSTYREFTIDDALKYYPIKENNTWVYEGWTKITEEDGNVVTKNFDDYTVRITKVIRKQNLVAALVNKKNGPFDDGKDRKSLLIFIGGRLYEIGDETRVEEIIKTIETKQYPDDYIDVEGEESYDFPLYVGKHFGFVGGFFSASGKLYNNRVGESAEMSISGVANHVSCFKVLYEGAPDENYTWFCPGIGEVEYSYTHHGPPQDIYYRIKSYYVSD